VKYLSQKVIEARADELWRRNGLSVGFDAERLLDDLGLDLLWEAIPDHADGVVLGQLVPTEHLVVLNQEQRERLEKDGGRQRRFTISHEVGHWDLHCEHGGTDQLTFLEEEAPSVLCRNAVRDDRERQAERYGAYLLMPSDLLLERVQGVDLRQWRSLYRLRDDFHVSISAMKNRLTDLGLLYISPAGELFASEAEYRGINRLV
jgi:hypothetical protein